MMIALRDRFAQPELEKTMSSRPELSTFRSPAALLVAAFCLACAAISSHSAAQGIPNITWMSGGHAGNVTAISLASGGKLFASVSPGDYTVKIWDTSDGHLIRTLNVAYTQVRAVAFSPDGQYIASGQDWLPGWDDATLKLWRVSDGQLITSYNFGAFYNIASLAFSPDGTKIAAGCDDFNVRTFDVAGGALLHTMSGHNWFVFSVAFSPDGTKIASGSGDNTAKIWDANSGALLHTLTGHTFFVASVSFSPDSSNLATGSWDHTIRIWNVASGTTIKTLTGPAGSPVYAVAYSPDGQFVASGGSEPNDISIVRIWQISNSSIVQTMPGHLAALNDLEYSPDGSMLISCGADSVSRFWNASTGQLIRQIGVKRAGVNDVEFSPDGTLFAAANTLDATELGGDIELIDADSGAIVRNCTGHTDIINGIGFSHDQQKIASAAGSPPPDTTDPTVRVWNVADASQLLVLPGHGGGSTAVQFSIDNQFIASGGRDAKVKIWNSTTGALLKTISGHNFTIRSLAFSPDGQLLASGSDDATIKLWHVPDWTLVRTISVDWPVSSIDFSSDSQNLAVGLDAYGNNVQLRRVSDGALLHAYAGDPFGYVDSVDLSPDGSTIVSTSGYTHIIQLWDVGSEALLQYFDHETGWGPDPVLPVAFSPDGSLFGYGRGDATIVMAYLGGQPKCGPGDVTCDGIVNVDDLLAVINGWGPCPAPPASCPADVAPPPQGHGVVNVDDLLMVINNWG